MKANPEKVQAICVGKKCHDIIKSFRFGDTGIMGNQYRFYVEI